jgi:hypothetical protein
MLMISVIFLGGEDLRSKFVLWNKMFVQNIGDEYRANILKLKWLFIYLFMLTSKFQNKIIIWEWDAKPKKLLWYMYNVS